LENLTIKSLRGRLSWRPLSFLIAGSACMVAQRCLDRVLDEMTKRNLAKKKDAGESNNASGVLSGLPCGNGIGELNYRGTLAALEDAARFSPVVRPNFIPNFCSSNSDFLKFSTLPSGGTSMSTRYSVLFTKYSM
jgi:hypothetical protein